MADDPLLSSLNDQTLSNAQGIGDSMADAADAARRLNSELRSSNLLTVEYSKLFTGIKTSASAVGKIQDKAKLTSKAVNDATREQIKNLTSVRELNTKIEDLYRRARKETEENKVQLIAQATVLAIGRDNAQELANIYGGIVQDASKLNSQTAFFNVMSEFVKDIPGLRVFSKPFEDAAIAARKTAIENAKIMQTKEVIRKFTEKELTTGKGLTKERLKQLGLSEITGETAGREAGKLLKQYRDVTKEQSKLGSGIKGFAKSAAASTASFFKTGGFLIAIGKGIQGAVGLLVKGLKSAVKFLLEIDNRAANLAKSLNMTKLEAAQFDFSILKASGGIDYLNQRLGEAADLAASFADSTGIIATDLKVFNADLGVINRRFGLSEQQTSEIAKNILISGQSSKEFAVNALGAAEALEMQSGINLQNQAIMKDIAELSATQFLNLKRQPGLIANAVTQARRFGLTMATIEGTQSSLLNFSQSITDEINAELLLGKQLNLSRARSAALQNDYATVAAEISREIGTAADFSEMNYFQQEALAKSVGMTKEELAKALKEQEALEAAGFASAEAREEEYNKLKKIYGEQEALRRIGMKEYTRQKENISFQEKMNNLLHNMKMIFVQSINPLLQKVTTFLSANPKFIQNSIDKFKNLVSVVSDFISQLIKGGPLSDKLGDKLSKMFGTSRKEGESLIETLKNGMKKVGETIYRVGLVLDGVFIKPILAAVDALQASFKFIQAVAKILSGDFTQGINLGIEGVKELNKGAANFFDAGTNVIVGISGEGQANFFNKLAKGEINLDGTPTDLSKNAADSAKTSSTFKDEQGNEYTSTTEDIDGSRVTTTPLGGSIIPPKKKEKDEPTNFNTLLKNTSKEEKTNKLLERLIQVVEKGGDVYLDSRKVGEALVLSTTRQ
jgi:hypothetical protein